MTIGFIYALFYYDTNTPTWRVETYLLKGQTTQTNSEMPPANSERPATDSETPAANSETLILVPKVTMDPPSRHLRGPLHPQGVPRATPEYPFGAQSEPRGTPRVPNGDPMEPKGHQHGQKIN